MFRAILLTTALVAPSQLFAQATTERAAVIAAELDRYLPGDARVVEVTPSGADYTVTLNLEAMTLKQVSRGLTVKAEPLILRLTEEAGGTYAVSYDQALSAKISYRDEFNLDMAVARVVGSGQFDPSLGAFISHEMTYTDLSYVQDYGSQSDLGSVTYRLGQMTAKSAAKANPAGGIDVVADYRGTDLVEDLTMPNPSTGELMPVSIKAASYDGKAEATGVRSLELLDLVAFGVANFPPSPNAPAQQNALKDKLRAAAPFFASLSADNAMQDVSVETPVGTFAAATAVVDIAANGAVAEGAFEQRLSLTGLSLPEGLVPAWVNTLIPEDSSFGFSFDDFDLAAPLAILLDRVDFKTGPTSAQSEALGKAILPSGAVQMGFTIGSEAKGTYELEASGSLAIGPEAPPSGTARVSVAGIDAILSALNEAPPEVKRGAIPAVGMARGLGKTDGDATIWEIEMTEDGKLLVNGNDLSMFMQ